MHDTNSDPLISPANAPMPIWISSPGGKRYYFNSAWFKLTGREEVRDYVWIDDVHPDDRDSAVREYSAASCEQRCFASTYRLRHTSGTYRRIKETGVPTLNQRSQFDGFVGYCIDIEDQRQAEEARREMTERLIMAQESERTRIARELHDDISQSLVVIGIQMLRAGQPVSGEPGQKHPGIPELYEKLKGIAQKVSSISHELHSSSLEYLGLTKAIQGYCLEFSRQYHIAVDCRCAGVSAKLNGISSLCILRVVQESLNNVAKHSKANSVQVELVAVSEDKLQLTVRDDGIGFDLDAARLAGGIGLISMRERMKLVDATCVITSAPGNGTVLTCLVPIR